MNGKDNARWKPHMKNIYLVSEEDNTQGKTYSENKSQIYSPRKKGKIHPTNNRDERALRTRHPTNNQDERTLRTRHSRDDRQARSLGPGNPASSMAANAHAKHNDPYTALRANRIDTTEDYGPTGAGRYTARRGRQQHFRLHMTEKTYEW